MKSLFLPLLALAWSIGALAWEWGNFPSCTFACINGFISSSYTGGYTSFCQNASLVANVNSCIATSNCATSDKEAAYRNVTQVCTDVSAYVTTTPKSTVSARSDSAWPTSSNSPWSGKWGTGYPGYGPFGGSWGPWGSSGPWMTGPWTSWWGGSQCPDGKWPGWTSGTWSTDPPWTTWAACTATTTAISTYTTISAGSVVTGLSYGVKVAQQTGATGTTATTIESNAVTSDSPSKAVTNKAYVGMAFISLIVSFLVVIQ